MVCNDHACQTHIVFEFRNRSYVEILLRNVGSIGAIEWCDGISKLPTGSVLLSAGLYLLANRNNDAHSILPCHPGSV